jgi:broad specificity phosphatase PhoE
VPKCLAPDAIARADVVLLRHGETVYNTENRLSGDPSVVVPLSPDGSRQCEAVRPLLEPVRWAALYVTRFLRTVESLDLMLPGHPTPAVLADLDDIDVGEFEGRDREDYRAWRHQHAIDEAPAGGEARLHVLARYARGLDWLAGQSPTPALAVVHDQPVRYLENALAGEHPILGPLGGIENATPYGYSREQLARGAEAMRAYLRPTRERDEAADPPRARDAG